MKTHVRPLELSDAQAHELQKCFRLFSLIERKRHGWAAYIQHLGELRDIQARIGIEVLTPDYIEKAIELEWQTVEAYIRLHPEDKLRKKVYRQHCGMKLRAPIPEAME